MLKLKGGVDSNHRPTGRTSCEAAFPKHLIFYCSTN